MHKQARPTHNETILIDYDLIPTPKLGDLLMWQNMVMQKV